MQNEIVAALFIVTVISAIMCIGSVTACLLVWRGCMKMYTEYFKDVSARSRKKEEER